MTIFARDLDTGMAKWVYQMTPHDEWDFDGVNEMPLIDVTIKGKKMPALVHFDRNGFGYTLNRETGELLVAEKYDPTVNWATKVDMKSGRPIRRQEVLTGHVRARRQREGHLPRGARFEGPAAFELRPQVGLVHGSDEPRMHELRAVPGRVHRWSAVCRRHGVRCSRRRTAMAAWVTSSRGIRPRARSSGRSPSASPCGPAR